ncbi:hypothetical protein VULLAG_LOCUS13142 [Vulpes lagopus]
MSSCPGKSEGEVSRAALIEESCLLSLQQGLQMQSQQLTVAISDDTCLRHLSTVKDLRACLWQAVGN